MKNHETTPIKWIDAKRFHELTGLHERFIYRHGKSDPAFPRAVKMGGAVRWIESEVMAWLEACIAESRANVATQNAGGAK